MKNNVYLHYVCQEADITKDKIKYKLQSKKPWFIERQGKAYEL